VTKSPHEPPLTETEIALGDLLDSTLVARRHHAPPSNDAEADPDASHRWDQWVAFSQKGDESYVTLSDGLRGSVYSMSEVRPRIMLVAW
jgi:telomerase reverse transcriptase